MSKKIYLIKTHGCTACKCMEHLLEKVVEDTNIDLDIIYFDETPEWIKTNVLLTDFPTTVFIDDNAIRYTFVGTKSVKRIKDIMKDIKF